MNGLLHRLQQKPQLYALAPTATAFFTCDQPDPHSMKLNWQSVISNTLQIIDLKPQYFRLFTIQTMIALLDGFYTGH